MVQPEQPLQALRVLLIALELVDQCQLLVHQRPAAPRQGLEHVADLQLQPGLLAGQQDGLLVQFVDRVRDLSDLLGGVHRDRPDRARVSPAAHLLELARQFGVRDLQRTVAQPAQRPDQ